MSQTSRELEQALRDFDEVGTLIQRREDRQIWRFAFGAKSYLLHFHPRGGCLGKLRRLLRGSPALRHFLNLQALQRAKVPAPRAVAMLVGFRLGPSRGDAVIVEDLGDAKPLDAHLAELECAGRVGVEHRALARQLCDVVQQLGRAALGHAELSAGAFVVRDGRVLLADARGLRRGGLHTRHVLRLAHDLRRWATRTDLLRAWRQLQGDTPLPPRNDLSPSLWRAQVRQAFGENESFGRLKIGSWRGYFFKRTPAPRPWSPASRLAISAHDWAAAWPALLAQIASDQFEILKRSPAGDVLAGEIVLAGHPIAVVAKRPRRRYWYRHLTELGRGSRIRRAWRKAWQLVARDIPTAWPLAMMERRILGHAVDQILVCERIEGPDLVGADLDALSDRARGDLFFAAGRMLRRIEDAGLFLYDAKGTNWMVPSPPRPGAAVLLVDTDGVRRRRVGRGGVQRLLRSVREHRQYRPQDQRHLLAGYRPFHAP